MPALSIRIALDCFYLLIFYSEKFSTDVCRLPYAVNVNLNLSYVSLQSQCLPRLIRVSQNNRYFFHVIKSKKGFIYDSRDIHCLKRTSCSTGVKFRKSSKSSSPGQTWIFKCDELN